MIFNYAFIDGQNLHLGTQADNWKIDLRKFRIYLRDKYKVSHAYYFLGFRADMYADLYAHIKESGFILIFREHHMSLTGKKKGNVDTDIVFEICKSIIEKCSFEGVIIVSGDGDYIKLVKYLIHKSKFTKMLFPNNKFASSLYKDITAQYCDYLNNKDIKRKIEHI